MGKVVLGEKEKGREEVRGQKEMVRRCCEGKLERLSVGEGVLGEETRRKLEKRGCEINLLV